MLEMDISEFTSRYLLEEKLFIVPSRSIGLLMINHMVKSGGSALNLKPITLERLSFEICERYIEENEIVKIDDILGKSIVLDCLKRLNEEDEEFFFKRDLLDIKTAEEVYKVIMELKSKKIEEFPKEKDLDKIYSLYTQSLKALNAMDFCDVMVKALEVKELKIFTRKIIGVASNIEFHNLEKDLFNALGDKKVKIIMPVRQLNGIPKEYFFKEEAKDEIFKKNIQFFNGYGVRNEVDYIIKDIFKKRIPLDEVVIAYTDKSYIEHLRIEFEKNNLAINFAEGLNITSSRTYRFIKSLFELYNNYYGIREIQAMFFNGSLNIEKEYKIKGGSISPSAMYEELVSLRASDGRDIRRKLLHMPSKLDDYSKDRRVWLKEFFEEILFPSLDEEIKISDYIDRIISLIKKYVKDITEYDKVSKDEIINLLRALDKIDLNITKEEYFNIVLNYIENIRVDRGGTNPSAVFACSYSNAGYTGRKNLYLIGLDSGTVNSEIVESPILLDSVRRDISLDLSFSKERYKYKKYKIKEALSANFENVSIGYSNFDLVDVKSKTPSSVYIELKEEFGQVSISVDKVEKLLAKDLVYSVTDLETLGQCTRKLYLKRAMGLKEKDDIDANIDRWLDPLIKGSLVHNILNVYFDLKKEERDEKVLLEIVQARCSEMKEEIPYVLEDVYIREVKEIENYCKAIAERQERDLLEVLVNELSFGLPKHNRVFGYLDKQTVEIRDFKLHIRGAIDRIDIDEKSKEIKIIDYKTGNPKNFEERLRTSIGKGKDKTYDYSKSQKFQYFIYKKALENILEENDIFKDYKINGFSYEFQDNTLDLKFDERFSDDIEAVIYSLLEIDILENEKNIVYDSSDTLTCKYCEYSNICRIDSEKLKEEEE